MGCVVVLLTNGHQADQFVTDLKPVSCQLTDIMGVQISAVIKWAAKVNPVSWMIGLRDNKTTLYVKAEAIEPFIQQHSL
jgi:hypothetical protein